MCAANERDTRKDKAFEAGDVTLNVKCSSHKKQVTWYQVT